MSAITGTEVLRWFFRILGLISFLVALLLGSVAVGFWTAFISSPSHEGTAFAFILFMSAVQVLLAIFCALFAWHTWFGTMKQATDFFADIFAVVVFVEISKATMIIDKAHGINGPDLPSNSTMFVGLACLAAPFFLAILTYKVLKSFFARFDFN
jgi:hypothetical protein